jgi:hypothetical protein
MSRIALGFAVLVSALGSAAAGEQMFDRLAHDFGPIPRGPTQTTTFTVTNKSAEPLRLSGFRIPCNCVRGALTKNELKPGESTTVVVYLDTRRVTGVLDKSLFVQTDRQEVRLSIKAHVREDLIVAPESLDFGRVKQGDTKSATVTVLLAGQAVAKNVSAKCDSEFVKAKVRRLPDDGNGASYEVTANLMPNLPAGVWYTTVWLTTDNPAVPRFPITANVEIQGKGKTKN